MVHNLDPQGILSLTGCASFPTKSSRRTKSAYWNISLWKFRDGLQRECREATTLHIRNAARLAKTENIAEQRRQKQPLDVALLLTIKTTLKDHTRAQHNSEGKPYFYVVQRRTTIIRKSDGQPYLYTAERVKRTKKLTSSKTNSHRRSFNSLLRMVVFKNTSYKERAKAPRVILLAAKTIQSTPLPLERIHNIHSRHSLPPGMLSISHSVTNDILQEDLENTTSFLIDQPADSLHTSPPG